MDKHDEQMEIAVTILLNRFRDNIDELDKTIGEVPTSVFGNTLVSYISSITMGFAKDMAERTRFDKKHLVQAVIKGITTAAEFEGINLDGADGGEITSIRRCYDDR